MSTKPAIVLLNPGTTNAADQDCGLPHLVALGSYLQQLLAVRSEIIDIGYEEGDLGRVWSRLEELAPLLLIGVSCYSSYDYRRARALGELLRERYPDVPRVVGGYHPSALPDDFVGDGAAFDYAIVGEGELPLSMLAAALLGGDRPPDPILGPQVVENLDELPSYDWSLLRRYLPRMSERGRKWQIYLSRGCPFHCTFCMERCKASRRWRPFSPERALEELHRLARTIELRHWVINIADPLFGLQPAWRRRVLDEIATQGLVPRQYWTLTRVDTLETEDLALYARARFALGVGLESGSPRMLEVMRKSEHPARYLAGIERFAALARVHRLNWAANLVLGHPGEDQASLAETRAFVKRLFPAGQATPGWLSVDPFRLYPGSEVFEQLSHYTERFGTRFPFPRWWKQASTAALGAEVIDPSATLRFAERVTAMTRDFGGLVREIERRFSYTGRSIDQVFERSLHEQVLLLEASRSEALLRRAARLQRSTPTDDCDDHAVFEPNVLADHELASAWEELPAELRGSPALARWSRVLAAAALCPGDAVLLVGATAVADAAAAALACLLVGPRGKVLVQTESWRTARTLRRALRRAGCGSVHVQSSPLPAAVYALDAIIVLGSVPRLPARLAHRLGDEGRLVAAIGPRYRAQQLVLVLRCGDDLSSRELGAIRLAPLRGEEGWLRPRGGLRQLLARFRRRAASPLAPPRRPAKAHGARRGRASARPGPKD